MRTQIDRVATIGALSLLVIIGLTSLVSTAEQPGAGAQEITITCQCLTKAAGSHCQSPVSELQAFTYHLSGRYENPDRPHDADSLQRYCHRNADAACLCTDVDMFSGKIE